MQTPAEQQPGLVHWLPGQQALPGPPHAWQTLLLQTAFVALHLPAPPPALAQQGEPSSPHWVQVPALQVVPAAVQTPVPQQGKPAPPQVPQAPALQVPSPKPTQAPPGAMQIWDTQQPSPLQPLPSQQGRPGWPQAGTELPPLPALLPPTPPAPPPAPIPPPPWTGMLLPPRPAPPPVPTLP